MTIDKDMVQIAGQIDEQLERRWDDLALRLIENGCDLQATARMTRRRPATGNA